MYILPSASVIFELNDNLAKINDTNTLGQGIAFNALTPRQGRLPTSQEGYGAESA